MALRTRLLRTAVPVLLLALAAGCNGSAAGPESPTPRTTTAPATPTPTASTEPTLPEAATKPGKAGAEAFVRHYWDMVNYAQQTGDVSGLKRLSAPECEPCTGGWKRLKDIYASGGNIEGGEFTVDALTARLVRSDSQGAAWTVDAHISFGPQKIVQPGSEPTTDPGGKLQFRFFNRHRQGVWDVTGMQSGELP